MKDAPVLTLEERIQRLEDTEVIKSIMYHYTRCTDNLDAEGIAAMFTDTGTFCSPALGNPTGRKAIAELYAKLLPGKGVNIREIFVQTRHYPMEEGAEVTSSEKRLEQIFSICKNAVKYGTQEAMWIARPEKKDNISGMPL